MLSLKRLGRIFVCCAMCFATVLLMVYPTSALTYSSNALLSDMIPEAPAVLEENLAVESVGHTVSKVYRSASYSSTVIGCMEDGTQLKVLGTKGKFYKIDCYEMAGYIPKSQVERNESGEYYVNCQEGSSQTRVLNSTSAQQALENRNSILEQSKKYMGVKYVWGGTTPKGFDCSGYVRYVFQKAGVSVSRSAFVQMGQGVIIAKEDLQCGDLVFFSNTGRNGSFCSHVGIYIGNGKMIHCGSSKGVVIVDLDASYWVKHYQCARRIVLSDVTVAATIPTVGVLTSSNASYWRNTSSDDILGMN